MKATIHPEIGECKYVNGWLTPREHVVNAEEAFRDATVIPYRSSMRMKIIFKKKKQVWTPQDVRDKRNLLQCGHCNGIFKKSGSHGHIFRGVVTCDKCLLTCDDEARAFKKYQQIIEYQMARGGSSNLLSSHDRNGKF